MSINMVKVMNIETTKLELMHLLLQTQKESILTKLKKVFDEEQTDWWGELSKEEQAEIEAGLKRNKRITENIPLMRP
ncbi:hypothetical protein [Maribacter sp. 2304DJ31-5]|uniref:hypothetical protein n=1 Tax=Maribacter sp. 2304DJ31-5 TaxID=3386273 RepID=UPI0039BD1014